MFVKLFVMSTGAVRAQLPIVNRVSGPCARRERELDLADESARSNLRKLAESNRVYAIARCMLGVDIY